MSATKWTRNAIHAACLGTVTLFIHIYSKLTVVTFNIYKFFYEYCFINVSTGSLALQHFKKLETLHLAKFVN